MGFLTGGEKFTNEQLCETLPHEFFLRDTVTVARELLGTVLCRRLADGSILHGRIVETEAYTQDDPACHAYKGKTPRCEVMFGPGGFAYVYFIYGMYNCLNVVTEIAGKPGAVLIRAVAGDGTNGPGKLCRRWEIDRSHNGSNLMDTWSPIWIAKGVSLPDEKVLITERIGLSVAQEKLWRFAELGHPSVSGSKSLNRARTANLDEKPIAVDAARKAKLPKTAIGSKGTRSTRNRKTV